MDKCRTNRRTNKTIQKRNTKPNQPKMEINTMTKTRLQKLENKYEKICDKLDNLNAEAYELEQEMMIERRKTK